MFSRTGFALLILLGLGASAQGQVMGGMGQMGMGMGVPPITTHLKGTVAGVTQGVVGLTTTDEAVWQLRVSAMTEVHVRGTASSDMLSPGVYVRFVAPVEIRRSTVQGQVAKLTIFTPSQDKGRLLGVQLAGQGEDEAAGEPIVNDQPAVNLRPAQTLAEIETFDIRGRLTTIRGKWLTVLAENNYFKSTLRFELADSAEIDLDINNYLLAAQGDPIVASGTPFGMQMADAVELTIDLSKPVGEQEQSGRSGSRRDARSTGVGRPATGTGGGANVGRDPAVAEKSADGPATRPSAQQLKQYLQASAEESRGKPPVSLRIGPGDAKKFTPCKQVSAKDDLAQRFGEPDQTQPVAGSLALGAQGELTQVRWQLWVYGSVMIFVDEAGKTRYMYAGPEGR